MEVEQKESKIKTYREVAKHEWGLGKKISLGGKHILD